MTQATTNINIGDCHLIHLSGVTETDLGATEQGSTLKIGREAYEMLVHRLGDTPYNAVYTKMTVEVEAILMQRDMDKLALALKGTKRTDTGKYALDIDPRPAGVTTFTLIVRPVGALTDDASWILWKCYALPECEVVMSNKKEQCFKIRFKGLLDEHASGAVRMLRLGDADTAANDAYFPSIT